MRLGRVSVMRSPTVPEPGDGVVNQVASGPSGPGTAHGTFDLVKAHTQAQAPRRGRPTSSCRNTGDVVAVVVPASQLEVQVAKLNFGGGCHGHGG
jgi:hypothetical protein